VILGVATFTQAASGFFMQGIGALGVHLQRGLDLSTAQLGLLLSASQLVPLVGLLVAGELLDRCDERWVVGIGAGVVAVSPWPRAASRPDMRPCSSSCSSSARATAPSNPAGASRWRPGSTCRSGGWQWASARRAFLWAVF
jgi:hypothetical protein